ncbi:NADPH-dependent FMN reductase [Kocuria rhizophila]|nr:NADPH-dependent FMN reductase [Kocuria rhizophila]
MVSPRCAWWPCREIAHGITDAMLTGTASAVQDALDAVLAADRLIAATPPTRRALRAVQGVLRPLRRGRPGEPAHRGGRDRAAAPLPRPGHRPVRPLFSHLKALTLPIGGLGHRGLGGRVPAGAHRAGRAALAGMLGAGAPGHDAAGPGPGRAPDPGPRGTAAPPQMTLPRICGGRRTRRRPERPVRTSSPRCPKLEDLLAAVRG